MREIKLKLSIFARSKLKKPLVIRRWLILLFIFFVIFSNFQHFIIPLVKDLKYIAIRTIRYPDFATSYENKMKEKVGKDYYDWSKLVRSHTSSASLVFHPPQMYPWPQSGNPEFSQYFLYPAKLIREDRQRILDKGDITHILIAWGEDKAPDDRLYGWPKFPVFSQKTYFLPQRRTVEIEGIDGLEQSQEEAEKTIIYTDGKKFDISYSLALYDYWMKSTELPLTAKALLKLKVKSNWPNSTSLIARVSFGESKSAVFSSPTNKKVNEWESLTLDGLFQKALNFADQNSLPVNDMVISAIGIDTGHPAVMPYQEKWGIIEVETATSEREKEMSQKIANSQNDLTLGNINYLRKKFKSAFDFYQNASILDDSNVWAHYGLAQAASGLGEKGLAEKEYQKAISINPENPWFYYALGKFYQDNNLIDKAISYFKTAIFLGPDSVWAHLDLGKAYEEKGQQALAAMHYRLASKGPLKAFTSDGKQAAINLEKLEQENKEIINKTNNGSRSQVADALLALESQGKAQEEYKLLFKENSYVEWVDELSQSVFGQKGEGLTLAFINGEPTAVLDNYHSFLKFSPSFFPDEGSITIEWSPPETTENIAVNLIYQFDGFEVWLKDNKFHLDVFNNEKKSWQTVESKQQILKSKQWYKITISYKQGKVSLALDDNEIIKEISGGINSQREIYLGKGPFWSLADTFQKSGYFNTLTVSNLKR